MELLSPAASSSRLSLQYKAVIGTCVACCLNIISSNPTARLLFRMNNYTTGRTVCIVLFDSLSLYIMTIICAGDYRKCTKSDSYTAIMRCCVFGFQNPYHLISSCVGCILLKISGNGKDCIAHADFGHAIRAAGWGAGLICHRHSFQIDKIVVRYQDGNLLLSDLFLVSHHP